MTHMFCVGDAMDTLWVDAIFEYCHSSDTPKDNYQQWRKNRHFSIYDAYWIA